MPFLELRKDIARKIATHFNHSDVTAELVEPEFSVPPNLQLGYLAYPCFRLSKVLKKSPQIIASEIASSIKGGGLSCTATGPYANFRQDVGKYCCNTVGRIFKEGQQFGSDDSGSSRSIIIEFCSPNIAKPLAFHHIRTTLIGNTLANMYGFLGYKTIRLNFVGDWGTQFARLLVAVDRWSKPKGENHTVQELLDLYVKFHQEAENDESMLEEAANWLQQLEKHDPKATALWKQIRDVSIVSMDSTLKRLKVHFDSIEGESPYLGAMAETLRLIKEKGSARLSEGAYVVDLPGFETPALVQKTDGTTLYLTRDIAAAIDRFERFQFDKMYYVVSEQQKLHFKQLFAVLKKMGFDWVDRCEHLSFGTVLFESGRMSTRKGQMVLLDDVLNEAKALALQECTQKNPDLKDKETVAEMVGAGAVIFGELSMHRTRDFEFNWKEVLAFDGETGPYVQYSLVRCYSLLQKAKGKVDLDPNVESIPTDYQYSPEEEALIVVLSKLRSTLHQVVRENEPFYLTRYLIEVAKFFNRFYYQLPVLQAEDPIQRTVRVQLVLATRQVLSNGLSLLGIACPEEM